MDRDGDGFDISTGDCDGTSNGHPGRGTPYNEVDDDCNPDTADDDVDRDEYRALISGGDDCDDLNALIHPDGGEVPGNGVDENCDGFDSRRTDETATRRVSG